RVIKGVEALGCRGGLQRGLRRGCLGGCESEHGLTLRHVALPEAEQPPQHSADKQQGDDDQHDRPRLEQGAGNTAMVILRVFGRSIPYQPLSPISVEHHTLNRKCTTSPSWTMYSLPSRRHLPASLAPCSPLYWMKSSYAMTSARMNPFSKSVWMTPAACGAVAPIFTVQERTSFVPSVKSV